MTPNTLLASRYDLRHRLGRGGMGEVWVGFDTVLHREVAVKIVDLTAAEDPTAAERFRREARATAALSHDNVVTIFDSGTDGATAFLVMELLPGPTVAELIKERGPLPVDYALDLAGQTAAALSAAHRVGVVHRDIKPSNLMLDRRGRLKVVDFGIARLTEAASTQLTATSTVVGSAPYMAPEQADGHPATPATDLYSLGCVLMALLTGEPPFVAERPLAVLQQHIGTPAPKVSERRSDVPPAVDGLVQQLLSKAPEHRPANAEQVLASITSLRTSANTPTISLPPTTSVPPTKVISQPHSTPPVAPGTKRYPTDATTLTTGRRDRRHSPAWLTWPVAVATVVAVAAALLLILQPWTDEDGPAEQAAPSPVTSSTASPQGSPSPGDIEAPSTAAVPDPQAPSVTPSTSPQTLTESLAGLRDAIQAAAAAGEITQSAPDDLLKRVEAIEKRVDKGDTKDLDRKLEDFSRRLDDLVRKDKLTATGEDRIRHALAEVEN